MQRVVSIRGTSDGLVVDVGAGDLESVLRELDQKLARSASFFRGGRVALRVGGRRLNREEIEALGRTLHRWGVTLWAVESEALETRAAAQSLGLETSLLAGRPLAVAEPQPQAASVSAAGASEGLAVRRTLRAGTSLVHRGHILVIGDVNPGAEIVAGGDIVVWGKLRGTAHAGSAGDRNAVVCALRMASAQVRIADLVAPQMSEPRGRRRHPQVAFVRDGEIVVESWIEDGVGVQEEAGETVRRLWPRLIRRRPKD
jgi:septum site-determining protein MinC